MGTQINLEIINNTYEELTIVERTVWYESEGGVWTEDNGKHQLTMGYRGSGLLRFRSSNGELFSVVVGIGYNFSEWADVQVDLQKIDTGIKLHPEYYGGKFKHESHKEISKTTSKGAKVEIRISEPLGCVSSAVLEYSKT